MQLEVGKAYVTFKDEVISIVALHNDGHFVGTNGRKYWDNGACFDVEHSIVREHTPVIASSVDDVLSERGKRYGEFKGHAKITQELKGVMANCDNWSKLSHSQKEALEMIAHKIGRIMNGDPNYTDNWVDIAGYSQLVVKELENAANTSATGS